MEQWVYVKSGCPDIYPSKVASPEKIFCCTFALLSFFIYVSLLLTPTSAEPHQSTIVCDVKLGPPDNKRPTRGVIRSPYAPPTAIKEAEPPKADVT